MTIQAAERPGELLSILLYWRGNLLFCGFAQSLETYTGVGGFLPRRII
jgi:hypothetical protein